MGNTNKILKKYKYDEYYKIKMNNMYNNNKLYLLLYPKYLLMISKEGHILYKILYNSIKVIDIISDIREYKINDKINITLNNNIKHIINTYKNLDDNINIRNYILEKLKTKNIEKNYGYKYIKYLINDK